MKKRRLTLAKSKLALRVFVAAWRERRKAVLGFLAAATLEIIAFIISIYATAQLVGLLAQYSAGQSTTAIWFWLWTDVVAAAATGIAFWLMSWTKRLLYYRMSAWATREFQAALCRLDIPDFYDETVRNQINKAQGGYTWQISNINETVLDLIYGIARFAITALVVAQITWWLIPLIALFLLPALLLENRLSQVQWFVWDSKGDDRHTFWGLDWLLRQAKDQMELRSTQASSYILNKVDRMNHVFYGEQEREAKKPNRLMAPAKFLEVGGTATGSVLALQQFLTGVINFNHYFFVTGALLRIGGAVTNIFGSLNRVQEPLLVAQDFFAIIDRKPVYVDAPNAIPLTSKKAPKIEFKHVNFTYPGQTEPVFNDLSFTIESGKHIAIVGENGAGKSTLIKLLLRFYKPTSGLILLDGQDLQSIQIETWYNKLATLFQDFNQYPLTIQENIEIARPKHQGDAQRLAKAAAFGSVDSLVAKYPHGWQTVLDNSFEKGVEPSGGQWQRVALARAFYRGADVLILDEPTAAIDAKAEYDIFNNIFTHYQNKTAIIVSHRFSTVRRADAIIVVDHGKIVEQGSHSELIKQKGLYHELFTKQAEGYREE